jgi:hypothetical protein
MKPVLELFNQIMGLRGVRQGTVATHYLGACKCDITDSGVIGYDVAHGVLLLEHLEEAVENGGGVIVRQFQAEKIYVVTRAGSRLVPVKHIFGVRAGQGRWTGYQVKLCVPHTRQTPNPEMRWHPKKASDSSIGPPESKRPIRRDSVRSQFSKRHCRWDCSRV